MRLPFRLAGVDTPRSRRPTMPWSRSASKMLAMMTTDWFFRLASTTGISDTVPRSALPCSTASSDALPDEYGCSRASMPSRAK